MDEFITIKPWSSLTNSSTKKVNRDKTSLYIPTSIRNKIKHQQSKLIKNAFVNNDVKTILKALVLHGGIKARYSNEKIKGLEDDASKQQIIIYTTVLNKGYVLMYSRASKAKDGGKKPEVDPRLYGSYSIGFGGHTSDKDRVEVNLLIESFKDLMPALFPEISMLISATKGRVNELNEELGLNPEDFKRLELLGSFYLKLPKTADGKDSVHSLHTAICAVAEINDETIGKKEIKLPRSEFASAQWVKKQDLIKTFKAIEKAGGSVEEWSWVMAKEFLN